jgi:hypothetical protein
MHQALGQDLKMIMRGVEEIPFAGIAEEIGPGDPAPGFGRQTHARVFNRLGRGGAQQHVRHMPGLGDILQVAIGGAVADAVFHQRVPAAPVRCRLACWK